MQLFAWLTPFLAAQVLATAIPAEIIDNTNSVEHTDLKDKDGGNGVCNRKYNYAISRNKFKICGWKGWTGADLLKEIDHKRISIHKIKTGSGDGCEWWVKFQASAHWLDKYFEHAIRDAGGPKDTECKEVKDFDDVE